MARKDSKAWDPDTYGYGKHDYQHIDPGTVNPEDYAKNLRGEEEHFGDVREYNSAYNKKVEGNNVSLDDLSRMGTVIQTEAPKLTGKHLKVVDLPRVRSPHIWTVLEDEDGNRYQVNRLCTWLRSREFATRC